jgi:hypothetical protein
VLKRKLNFTRIILHLLLYGWKKLTRENPIIDNAYISPTKTINNVCHYYLHSYKLLQL